MSKKAKEYLSGLRCWHDSFQIEQNKMSLHYSVAISNTGTYKTKILILMEN